MEQKTATSPRFEITVSLTRRDCRKYLYWLSLRRTRQTVLKAVLLSLVLALVLTLMTARGNPVMFAVYFIGMMALYTVVFVLSMEMQLSSGKKKHTLPIDYKITYEFYKDHLARRGQEKKMLYNKFSGAVEIKSLLVLYYRGEGMLIPKADLPDDTQAEFFAFVKSKFGHNYHDRTPGKK